jgi:hypothetical protein
MEALTELNAEGDWYISERPFRHIRGEHVFREDCYRRLEKAFGEVKIAGPEGAKGISRFKRSATGYDALVAGMNPELSGRFSPLFDPRWIRLLAELLGLPPLAQVDGALHEVPVGSRSGWVHSDLCSGWFDARAQGDIVFPDRKQCSYFTGAPKNAHARPREYIRAATMIFYLLNDEWRRGAGGETGLYATSNSDAGEVQAVPPLNNSLLLFECSPHSYHRLLANPGCCRKSVILWLHSTVAHAQSKWGGAVKRRKPT